MLKCQYIFRQRIFVITVDCYNVEGTIEIPTLKEILDKVTSVDSLNGRIGYVLSTGSTLTETLEAIKSCHIDPTRFDALICCSGAEVCYPWRDTSADVDFEAHLGFRWPGEYVRETVIKVGKLDGADDGDLVFDETASSGYCLAYAVKLETNVSSLLISHRYEFFLYVRSFQSELFELQLITKLCKSEYIKEVKKCRPVSIW
jgi:hypothetical protein